jgi:hypothetical protein
VAAVFRSAWTGLGIAALLALLLALAGRWSYSALVALIVLAILGAILPPLALILGGVAVVYVLFRYGPGIFSKLQGDLAGGG